MQASHSYIEQNAKFLPLNFYVVQMLNTQLEFPCEVAPFLGGTCISMVYTAVTYRSKQPPQARKTGKNTANT